MGSSSSIFNLLCTHMAFCQGYIDSDGLQREKKKIHISKLFADIALLENQHKKSPQNSILSRLTQLREELKMALIAEDENT